MFKKKSIFVEFGMVFGEGGHQLSNYARYLYIFIGKYLFPYDIILRIISR